jgi:hypothetical protein
MLSGKKARTESNPMALAYAIAKEPAPDLAAVWPQAPRRAAQVLKEAMSRDPKRRPLPASALTARLRAALEPERAPTRRSAAPAAAAAPPTAATAVTPRRARSRPQPSAERKPPPAPAPVADRTRHDRRPALLALLLALLLVAGATAAILASSAGGGHAGTSAGSSTHPRTAAPARSRAASRTASTATQAPARTSSTSAPASTGASMPTTRAGAAAGAGAGATSSAGGGASAAGGGAGSPVAAVESFYHLAAAHRYSDAWALADPAFRAQLGGYDSFQSGQASDRQIIFNSARVVSQSATQAAVAVNTTSIRDNGTQHCAGTVNLARASGSWLLHQISINCT